MMRALFIRHGQSTANIGLPTDDFSQVPLTALGQQQALNLAATWTTPPSLIAVSPFLRAQQTAAPTIKRFPDVPVETWPVNEFTFWDPQFWKGGEPKDLMHDVDLYWTQGSADLQYGGGAESFAMLLQRAETSLQKLAAMDVAANVSAPPMIFTHGHFIQAVRLTVLHPEWTPLEKMRGFRPFDDENWVQNTQVITAEFDGTRWSID